MPSDEVPEKLKVLLADDHHVVRGSLRLLLESHFPFEVVEVATAEEAVDRARDDEIRLAFLDVRFPGRDGIWALGEIRGERPDLPVLMLSTFGDDGYVRQAVESGARGYVLKDATTDQLREAVEAALDGTELYLHPSVSRRLPQRRRSGGRSGHALTDRERQVLGLVVEGATNETIAETLLVSEKTVKSHLSSVFRKLEVANRTQAASKALREGIVTLGEG